MPEGHRRDGLILTQEQLVIYIQRVEHEAQADGVDFRQNRVVFERTGFIITELHRAVHYPDEEIGQRVRRQLGIRLERDRRHAEALVPQGSR